LEAAKKERDVLGLGQKRLTKEEQKMKEREEQLKREAE